MKPSFSIVIPTKDRPVFLRRAVLSALQELGPTGEIIVVDDHSERPACDVLREMPKGDLRIVELPDADAGVANARNAGFKAARGNIIFFLDDDDQFIKGYCAHVLNNAASHFDYGFSAYEETSTDTLGERVIKSRFAEGRIPERAPLRKKLCGFGMGFWINRSVAAEIGLVDPTLSINEDTDFICRLIVARKRGWYSARLGVSVHRHEGCHHELANLTSRTHAKERSRCMLVVCNRYPTLINHLGSSYLRHCVKAGQIDDAKQFIRQQTGWGLRARFMLLVALKMGAWKLRGKSHKKANLD